MEHEFHNLSNAILFMDELQAKHIEAFQAELLPDLERQTLERNQAFESLTSSLQRFQKRIGLAEDAQANQAEKMILAISEHITRLQQQNRMLVDKVEAYRADLQARMRGMTKGRQAIKSYGPPSSFTKRSRVISLTN